MSALAPTTSIPTGTWQLDPVHSTVSFEVPYVVGKFRGHFAEIAATLADGELSGTAEVPSLRVQDENLNAHLLSPEFFDAERHPQLRFDASSIVPGDEVAIDGELAIKGIARPVEVRGTVAGPTIDAYGNEKLGLALSTTVDRTQFDITWNTPLPNGEPALGNDVTIVAELSFTKAA